MAFDKTKLEVLHRGTIGGMALANYDTATPNHGRGTGLPVSSAAEDGLGQGTGAEANDISRDAYFPAGEVPRGGLIVFVTAKTLATTPSSARSSTIFRVYHDAGVVKSVDIGSVQVVA